jgi:hypothetical protein
MRFFCLVSEKKEKKKKKLDVETKENCVKSPLILKV